MAVVEESNKAEKKTVVLPPRRGQVKVKAFHQTVKMIREAASKVRLQLTEERNGKENLFFYITKK